MASQLVAVASLLLGSAFLLMAGGLHGLLLPVRGTIEGFTTIELGLLGTGWAAGFISGCLLVPAVVRRVGHIRSYGALASVSAATPQPLKSTRLDIRRLCANSPVSAIGCFLIGMVNGAFGPLGPVYAQQIGLPIHNVATLMAGALLGGALIQFPLGWLSDRVDRRRVLIAVTVGAFVIGTTLATFQPRARLVVIGLVIIFGAMIYPMYALTVAHANDFAAGDDFVNIAGGLLLLYGIGTMIGPIAAAQGMERIGPDGLFAFAAAIHLLMVVYTLIRMSRRARPDRILRETFRGLLLPKTVTPESAVLDPRSAGADHPGGDGPPQDQAGHRAEA